MRRAWTPEEDEQLRQGYARLTRTGLARRLGRSLAAVHQRASRLGLTSPVAALWTPGEDACLWRGLLPPGRTWAAAALRWSAIGGPASTRRTPWTADEDARLFQRALPPGRSWWAARARAAVLGLA